MHLTIRIFLLLTALVFALYHVEGKDYLFVRIFIFAILSYACYNVNWKPGSSLIQLCATLIMSMRDSSKIFV